MFSIKLETYFVLSDRLNRECLHIQRKYRSLACDNGYGPELLARKGLSRSGNLHVEGHVEGAHSVFENEHQCKLDEYRRRGEEFDFLARKESQESVFSIGFLSDLLAN